MTAMEEEEGHWKKKFVMKKHEARRNITKDFRVGQRERKERDIREM